MKKYTQLILISIFFAVCFYGICFLTYTKKTADYFLSNITSIAEKYVTEAEFQQIENPIINTRWKSHQLLLTYFYTVNQSKSYPHNFVEVELTNVSPLFCHFMMQTKNRFPLRLFINNKETFLGSNSNICFQKNDNTVHLYFELFNYTSHYQVQEPKLCLTNNDCESEKEICSNVYCKKINK